MTVFPNYSRILDFLKFKCLYQMWKKQIEVIVNHFSPIPVTMATKNEKDHLFTTNFTKYAIFH